MREVNAAFDVVLKSSPEAFVRSWLAEAAGGGSAGAATGWARAGMDVSNARVISKCFMAFSPGLNTAA